MRGSLLKILMGHYGSSSQKNCCNLACMFLQFLMLERVVRLNCLQKILAIFLMKFDDLVSHSRNADIQVRVAVRKMRYYG